MLRLFTAMMHQTFSQEPFLVSGLHGDQILGARSNQQDSFSILAGEDALVLVLADGMGIPAESWPAARRWKAVRGLLSGNPVCPERE